MTPAAKRATSADVANAAGVSRTTVSFVLNDKPGYSIPEETRRRVLDAAVRLDYRPRASARSLAAGRSDIVLLAIPDLPIGAGISRFVEELAGALAEHGLTMVTHLAGARGQLLPDVCAAVDASVVVGFDAFDEDTVQALYRAGADVVLPPRVASSPALQPIGRLQADHLIGRGHRRLGYAMPEHSNLRSMAEDRLDGVVGACLDAGLERPTVLSTSLEIARAAQAVAGWTERSVTGVCAFNDETAIAVLAGMRAHGLAAPGDLAVIGADDIPTARLTAPPLTTVCFDLPEVARQRAEEIMAVLSGRESSAVSTLADLQVVQRSST
ncbi:LacI family DNA-binding transcriptional regulator [Streptosporangium sp. 'caverna']|uniref:LacI family DNA-binding transcriptional regulator n=1 Tax=Streptosporangium sp. 'caverna' TaxID=2202249 RepID=UPI000D7D6435|nr:LacI family DNA-binding transcriptional regulator [Streptosporangium sp. 'caverna']AWS48420.1 LacI family transcriptional regulator [Streptosporangium sp. 'caverna']